MDRGSELLPRPKDRAVRQTMLYYFGDAILGVCTVGELVRMRWRPLHHPHSKL